MHGRHPDGCGCCSYCQHPPERHRRTRYRGNVERAACRVAGCECVQWRRQLELDPALPADASLIVELVERDLV